MDVSSRTLLVGLFVAAVVVAGCTSGGQTQGPDNGGDGVRDTDSMNLSISGGDDISIEAEGRVRLGDGSHSYTIDLIYPNETIITLEQESTDVFGVSYSERYQIAENTNQPPLGEYTVRVMVDGSKASEGTVSFDPIADASQAFSIDSVSEPWFRLLEQYDNYVSDYYINTTTSIGDGWPSEYTGGFSSLLGAPQAMLTSPDGTLLAESSLQYDDSQTVEQRIDLTGDKRFPASGEYELSIQFSGYPDRPIATRTLDFSDISDPVMAVTDVRLHFRSTPDGEILNATTVTVENSGGLPYGGMFTVDIDGSMTRGFITISQGHRFPIGTSEHRLPVNTDDPDGATREDLQNAEASVKIHGSSQDEQLLWYNGTASAQ